MKIFDKLLTLFHVILVLSLLWIFTYSVLLSYQNTNIVIVLIISASVMLSYEFRDVDILGKIK